MTAMTAMTDAKHAWDLTAAKGLSTAVQASLARRDQARKKRPAADTRSPHARRCCRVAARLEKVAAALDRLDTLVLRQQPARQAEFDAARGKAADLLDALRDILLAEARADAEVSLDWREVRRRKDD
jgi:hypothetical protein